MTDNTLIAIYINANELLFVVLIGIMIGYWYVFRDAIMQITGRSFSWLEIIGVVLLGLFAPVYFGYLLFGVIGGGLGGYLGKQHYELWQHKNDIQAMETI